MNCDEECAAEKTEAKEFAYFSGITTGRNGERKRILEIINDLQNEVFNARQQWHDNGLLILEHLQKKIEGKQK
jgi:hypothetical protein